MQALTGGCMKPFICKIVTTQNGDFWDMYGTNRSTCDIIRAAEEKL